jgi:hypothetical protein
VRPLIEFLPCSSRIARRPSFLLVFAACLIIPIAPSISQTPIQLSTQSNSQTTSFAGSTTTASPITLYGRVINTATGLPVPRALVRFNQRAMLADNEGRFRFDQVTDTTINLQAIKPGYSMTTDPSDPGSQSLQTASIGGPVDLRLYPEAILTGNISTPDGAPLSQIVVMARRSIYDESGHHWTIAGQAQTDRHGDFRIPVPAGDYKLETRYVPRNLGTPEAILPVILPAASGDTRTQAVHLRPGQELHFDIRPPIRPTYPVAIIVESSSSERGFPTVTARSSDGTSFNVGMGNRGPEPRSPDQSGPNRTSVTLPAGTYTLSARIQSRDTNETAEARVNVTRNADSSGATLRFTPTPTIPVELIVDSDATSDNTQGSVSNSSNTSTTTSASSQNLPKLNQFGLVLQRIDPVSDDDITTAGLSGPNSSSFAASPGAYRLIARTAGRWYIRSATYGSTDLARDPFTLSTGGAAATIRIVVTNLTGSLQGTVLLNGVPSPSWVYLIPNSPEIPSVITLHSGSSGNLNGPYVPPGSYRVIAFERRHYSDFSNPQSLAPFSKYIQTITVGSGSSSSVYLNAVPQLEVESHP